MSDFISDFWHWYVIVLTIASIAYCAWLLWKLSKAKVQPGAPAAAPGGRVETTGHTWDGDLAEFNNPRDVVPESNMPAYPWLATAPASAGDVQARMTALKRVGVPYTPEEIAKAPEELKGKTEQDALVAYLQNMGLAMKNVR